MARVRPRLNVALVADDLSPGAGLALRRAALLPGMERGAFRVLRVRPTGDGARPGGDRDEGAPGALRRRAEELLGGASAGRRRSTLDTAVVEGEPFVEIVRHARLVEADLLVVGAHARRSWRDAVVGTTAERVIRKGDVPVLVVKRPPSGPYRHALAAIEATDAGARVVELAMALLPPGGARLTVMHCFTVPFEAELSGGVARAATRLRREYRAERQLACERLVAGVRAASGRSPPVVVVHGSARAQVPRWLARERADLLVVGTHARSGMSHALLGSRAEALIRAAPCDVAVTRPVRFRFELP